MRACVRSLSCLLLALFSLSSARADSADVELARKLFQEGTQLARRGAWEEASHRFAYSANLRPHAVTKYNLAYCERVQGHLERARRLFLESIAEHTARGELELQPELLEIARKYVAELDMEIARTAAPPPAAAPTPTSTARASAASEPDARVPRDLNAGAYAGLVVGLAGLAAGVVTGAIAWSREYELAATCPNKRCSGEAADSLDRARVLADVATASFIVGGASLAVGAAFWLYSDAPPAPPSPDQFSLRPWVGFAAVGCSGRF